MSHKNWFRLCLTCLFFFLLTRSAFASGAELTNLVVKSTHADLLMDLELKGVFTNEMKDALLRELPVSFNFFITFYEVYDYWFDKKIANLTILHKIEYDASKKEYRVTRSWEKVGPLVTRNFLKARVLMSEIVGLKVIPLTRLKRDKHYQINVKSELNEKRLLLFNFPWEFETDWYTINFIY